MFSLYFFFNLVIYFISLKIFFLIYKDKYIFPLRKAEIINYIFNLFINLVGSYLIFGFGFILQTILINTCLAFCFFCITSMINTSPRTKILLDLKTKKFKLNNYLKYYNYEILLNNRIRRLKSNNEIIVRKEYIKINNQKKIKFLTIIIFLFNVLKKI